MKKSNVIDCKKEDKKKEQIEIEDKMIREKIITYKKTTKVQNYVKGSDV